MVLVEKLFTKSCKAEAVSNDKNCKNVKSCLNTNYSLNFAFTLSEVLVTLGVIGVVAAITMPILIKKYNEQVTVNKVKKTYSILNQAMNMSIANNGYPREWNISGNTEAAVATEIAGYLVPYLNIVKDCGTSNCFNYPAGGINLLRGGYTMTFNNNTNYKFILSDGIYVLISGIANENGCGSSTCARIHIDTNGTKGPNTIGKDVFRIALVIPKGLTYGQNNNDCRLNSDGWSCATFILLNGNMNYSKN